MGRWSIEHTAHSSASPDAVWDVWSDVAGWPRWNPTLAKAALEGPFEEGATVRLKHAKGRESTVTLRDVQPGAGFAPVSPLPGAEIRIEHEVASMHGGGSRVTQRAVLDGPLARVWALLLAGQLRQDVPAGTEASARAAESGATPS